jgi:hypothetical protein
MSSEELAWTGERKAKLSMKDHWENNPDILENLRCWSKSKPVPLLWIGGRSSNHDCWVTELSADIVRALSSQNTDMTLVFTFFQRGQTHLRTPMDFVKLVISRILELHPLLVVKMPKLLNPRMVRWASTFTRLWAILDSIIDRLDATFLIIDRIDLAADDQDGTSGAELLLPKLLDLVLKHADRLKVIVTSMYKQPHALENDLQWIWWDTNIRPSKRDRRI